MYTAFSRFVIAGIVVILLPSSGSAQGEVGRAIASLRSSGNAERAASILADVRGGHSQAERRALADTLEEIAISFVDTGGGPTVPVQASIASLAMAGSGGKGVPFPTAHESLARIVMQANSARVQKLALQQMVFLAARGRVVEFMAGIAASDDELASEAVVLLADRTGAVGSSRLRQLHRSRSVTEREARRLLDAIAVERGW